MTGRLIAGIFNHKIKRPIEQRPYDVAARATFAHLGLQIRQRGIGAMQQRFLHFGIHAIREKIGRHFIRLCETGDLFFRGLGQRRPIRRVGVGRMQLLVDNRLATLQRPSLHRITHDLLAAGADDTGHAPR